MSKIIEVIKDGDDYTKVIFENSKGKQFDYELIYHKETDSAGLLRNNIDHAGLWFDNKTLVDYDMVYKLSKAAIQTIRKAGFTVPRDFETKK